MQWLIDQLGQLDVAHDVEDDLVCFFADAPHTTLFVEVMQWSEPDVGVQVGLRAETMPLERLGSVGHFLGERPGLTIEVDLVNEGDRAQACLEFLMTLDSPDPLEPFVPLEAFYLDRLDDFLDEVELVLSNVGSRGTTFGVDYETQTEGFLPLATAERLDSKAEPALALQSLRAAMEAFAAAGLVDYQCLSLMGEADMHMLVGSTDRAHARLQQAEALLPQTTLTPTLRCQISTIRLRVLVAEQRWPEAQALLNALYDDPEFDIEDPNYSHALEASHLLSRARHGVGDSADFFTDRAKNLAPDAAPKARALIELNSGGALYETGDVEGAAEAFERAAELYEEAGAINGVIESQMALAIVYAMLEPDHRRAASVFDGHVHLLSASTPASTIAIARSAATALGRPSNFGTWDTGESDEGQARITRLNQAIGSLHKGDYWSARILATELLEDEPSEQDDFPDAFSTRISASALQLRSSCVVLEAVMNSTMPTQGQLASALDDGLASVRLFFQEQRTISSPHTRNSWIESFGRSYFFTVLLSMMAGEQRIALAILELVRAHELEVDVTAETFGESPEAEPTDPFDIVEVVVQDFVLDIEGCQKVAIEEVMAAQVPPQSVYWSQWLFGPCLLWAVYLPSGQVECGYIIFDEARLPGIGDHLPSSVDSDFMRDCERFAAFHRGERAQLDESERLIAARLGDHLIPAPLREYLGRHHDVPPTILFTPGEPVGDFPTPLLALDDQGTRLLDRSNLQIAAPAAATLRPTDQRTTPVTPTLVIDPTGEMPALHGLRRSQADADDGERRFWDCAQERGDFVFAGHAVGERRGEGRGLQLEPEEELLPSKVLAKGPNGVPDRIVLAGCSTSDLPDRGVHRSWTLPSIFLGLGSTEVITARQELWADETVQEITAHLINAMRSTEPLGDALHWMQRHFLDRHRTVGGDLPPAGQWASWATHRLIGRRG